MLLSHKHKFVFIKGKKVAGTSIEMALSTICGETDVITPITPIDELARINSGTCCQNFGADPDELAMYISALLQKSSFSVPRGCFRSHMSFEQVLNCTENDLDNYLYIVAERNPYSKVVSGAVFRELFKQYQSTGKMEDVCSVVNGAIDGVFEDQLCHKVYNFDTYSMHIRKPDFVIRYESLESDFNLLLDRLGIKCEVKLPHVKKSVCFTPEYACELLGKKRIDIINKIFQKEFDYFGYQTL